MASVSSSHGQFILSGKSASLKELAPDQKGPFYFAWVDANETTFNSSHYVYDETIFQFQLGHEEGQIPTLEIEILNPNTGLLNSGRKQWAWFSWWNGSSVVPLFFGRLVGFPTDILNTTVKLHLIARANDYLTKKSNLAQGLKVAPFYDPIFIDPKLQNDPDAILEGYSAAWHVDRTSLDWTISDIIRAEDGTIVFTGSTVYSDSVKINVGQPPLKSVSVSTDISWTNTYSGSQVIGFWSVQTYTGDSLISDWPKQGSALGGGWTVGTSWAFDMAYVANVKTVNYTANFQNMSTSHAEGDTMSASLNYSVLEWMGRKKLISHAVNGQVGSLGLTKSSSPDVAGGSINEQWKYALCYDILCCASAIWTKSCSFSESLQVNISADVQNLLFDTTTEQETETIQLKTTGGKATTIYRRNVASVANSHIYIGTVIIDPNGYYQIAMNSGNTGSTPSFSTTVGGTTADYQVSWCCIGYSAPSVKSWAASTYYARGTLIATSEPVWTYYSSLVSAGFIDHKGIYVSVGVVVKADNGLSYQQCTKAGKTSGWVPSFSKTIGEVTTDGDAEWTSLGAHLGTGIIQLCVDDGVSGSVAPIWPRVGGTVLDGSVTWESLGTTQSGISTYIGEAGISSSATAYFATDRGSKSIEYCLARARAKILTRARAIEIEFKSSFENGINLSCRKGAQIQDARIPGGVAEGKIISYTLAGDGTNGEFSTTVKIGVPIGNAGTVSAVSGDDTYADSYADTYQVAYGTLAVFGSGVSDIAYSPIYAPEFNVSVGSILPFWSGSIFDQEGSMSDTNIPGISLNLVVPNIENTSTSASYNPTVTVLKIPKGIDLSAS